MGYKEGGWMEKYRIFKSRPVSECTDKCNELPCEELCNGTEILVPIDPKAVYFVLRLDTDPHARIAAGAYAQSVKAENPQLAQDIFEKIYESCTDFGQEGREHDAEKDTQAHS